MAVKSLKPHVQHLDKKLRFRLRIYLLISLILIFILIYNIIRGALRIEYGLISILVGIIIGIASARMFHISWNHDADKVVSRLDIFGSVILILYIVLEFFRGRIIGYFTHGSEVTAVTFALFAGVMFGRVLGMRGRIIDVLKEQI